MTKISKSEVEKIAALGRIELSEKEKSQYSGEMTEILGYVEKLKSVDTSGVSETSQVTGLENVYRKDIAKESTQIDKNKAKNRQELLRNAPAQKDGYIKTRAVLE